MDEDRLVKLIREVVKEELHAFKNEVATKDDLKAFATKDDLKAIKDDLKAFATKDDLKAIKDDLKAFATKDDFLKMQERLSSSFDKLREGVRLSVLVIEKDFVEIKNKFMFYDFDYLAKQNDAIAKLIRDIYDEKTIMFEKIREHENRLDVIEAKL